MKNPWLLLALIALPVCAALAQTTPVKVFTIFTSGGCGCTGSGGAPASFMTHDEVLKNLQAACRGIDFVRWEGASGAGYEEVQGHPGKYDGVVIIGRMSGDYRLAFTGLPTVVVYNLFEFMDGHPYHLLATGQTDEQNNVLKQGTNYPDGRILTAQLDRRNLSVPWVRESMFQDLVDKLRLIQVVAELRKTRILMVKRQTNETIASVNYRGDLQQTFPPDHNERYTRNLKELFGVEIVPVEAEEFYAAYQKVELRQAEAVAEQWMRGARKVEAGKTEIVKTARGYLALDSLRIKHDCNAVSTHLRSVTGSGKREDLFNPGLGLELGFKRRGIQAVCQNYPDLLVGQVLGYLLTGRPSMLGDFFYDTHNSVEVVLHCGIPVNPYGDDRLMPYTIRPHAESPVRDKPEEPGSSTGITAEWPVGEPVTLWEVHALNREIRLHTGHIVNGREVYSGSEDLDNVMCTAKVVARIEKAEQLQREFRPYLYGIHRNATLGDLRQQLKDVGVFLGIPVVERDR